VSCPVCNAGQIVKISVELGSESMVLHSCSRCDSRWWDDASGNRMSLENVLTLAGRSGRRRRRTPLGPPA
jgi:hypothetical protein